MGTNKTTTGNTMEGKRLKLPGLLKRYENSDFALQQRAQFIFYLLFACMISMVFIFLYTTRTQLSSTVYGGKLYSSVLLPVAGALFLMFVCLFFLIKGHFSIAAHLLMISTICTVWIVMWNDKNNDIMRLDTFVLVLAALTMLPLVVKRNKWLILFYVCANIGFLVFFFSIHKEKLEMPVSTIIEYLSEVSIALFFIGVVGFNIFRINKQALDNAVSDYNEKVETEKALKESETKYREMTEMLPETVFEADLTGRLTYVNQTGTAVFGISHDEVKRGASIFSGISRNDRKRAMANFRINSNGGPLVTATYTAIRKDGSYFPIEIYSKPFFRDNKLAGIRGIIVDITERYNSDRALRESEERYRALMEGMNEVIIVADNNHVVSYVNKQFTEKLGFTPEEIIGKVGYKLLHDPADLRKVENANTDRINDRSTVYELTFKAKDGRKIDCLVSGAPYKDIDGNTIGSIGALMDITELKKAEKALRESEQQFQTLAEMSPVGIFRTRPDGFTSYVNPRWTEISGLCFEEALGDGWLKAVHPDDKEMVSKRWNNDAPLKTKSIAEYRFLKPDGTTTWVLGNAVPEIVDNELRGYIGTITNITESKLAQQELEKYRNHLEHLVDERTLDLATANQKLKTTNEELDRQRNELQFALDNLRDAQNKLIQAEKMASLGVLAAGIAHEINNPLNFINGGALGLEAYINENMKGHMDEVAPLIEGIQVGVQRAAEIVSSLNLYSRRDDLPGSECKIHSIIDSCLVMLNNEIKYRIEVEKVYTNDPLVIFGNEGRFHQVFLNVLTNAIHAISGKGAIKIVTRAGKKRGFISITDNGCGMTKDIINKITDPFFTTKDPGKGTGLGLSITYNILKDYNGTIEFESERGKGTKVIIALPLYKGED